MASTKNAAAAAATPETSNGTEQKTAKPKRERVFTSSLNLQELRKREQKLNQGFNRMVDTIKKMGISSDNQTKILEILKAEHELKAKEVFSAPASAATASAESFV